MKEPIKEFLQDKNLLKINNELTDFKTPFKSEISKNKIDTKNIKIPKIALSKYSDIPCVKLPILYNKFNNRYNLMKKIIKLKILKITLQIKFQINQIL